MIDQTSILKRLLLVFAKIGGGLIAVSVLFLVSTVAINSLGEVKKYSHCNTYDPVFLETAQARNITPDSSRIMNLRSVGVELVLYYENNKHYPVVTSGTSVERWNNLLDTLGLTNEDKKKLSDPCLDRNADYQYSYGSDSEGTNYVLRAILSEEVTYESEWRNEIYGLWCGESNNDREYCVGPL